VTATQEALFEPTRVEPFKTQLLKWVGNKQKMAHLIAEALPDDMRTYHELFLGSGAVLGTLAPRRAYGSDALGPLVEIWQALSEDPSTLKRWYAERRDRIGDETKTAVYADVLRSYNSNPNGADLVFLCRTCYGGVVRFRKNDGGMSTPCGAHTPIPSRSFAHRVDIWAERTRGTQFDLLDFREAFLRAEKGDVVYCDPPYVDTQAILYGAQAFSLNELYAEIDAAKSRGVRVALSIDGTKRSGTHTVDVSAPKGLFESELDVGVGRSMLRRFQLGGYTLESEQVTDRLLLTY